MSKSVKSLKLSRVFTPSAYSNAVILWCEKVGFDWLFALKSDGSVYTKPASSPSKKVNCQN